MAFSVILREVNLAFVTTTSKPS